MSVTNTHNPVVLEPASLAVGEATAKPPFLYELSPAEARAVLHQVQAAPIRAGVRDRPVDRARGRCQPARPGCPPGTTQARRTCVSETLDATRRNTKGTWI
jgi:hypothetical protein